MEGTMLSLGFLACILSLQSGQLSEHACVNHPITIPQLVAELNKEPVDHFTIADFEVFFKGDPAAAKALEQTMCSGRVSAIIAAADAHWRVTGSSKLAMTALLAILKSKPSRKTQSECYRVFAYIAMTKAEREIVYPFLIKSLDASDCHEFFDALHALENALFPPKKVLPLLLRHLVKDTRENRRIGLILSLSSFPPTKKCIEMLKKTLEDDQSLQSISQAAIITLCRLGEKGRTAVLRFLQSEQREALRQSCLAALRSVKGCEDTLARQLLSFVNDKSAIVRAELVRTLWTYCLRNEQVAISPTVGAVLRNALKDPDPLVRLEGIAVCINNDKLSAECLEVWKRIKSSDSNELRVQVRLLMLDMEIDLEKRLSAMWNDMYITK